MSGQFDEQKIKVDELIVSGGINKVGLLINLLGVFFTGGTFELKDHYYTLAINHSDLCIGYLGKYASHELINRTIQPKDVRVLKLSEIKQIMLEEALFGMAYQLKMVEENKTEVYYIGKKYIEGSQLVGLKNLIYEMENR